MPAPTAPSHSISLQRIAETEGVAIDALPARDKPWIRATTHAAMSALLCVVAVEWIIRRFAPDFLLVGRMVGFCLACVTFVSVRAWIISFAGRSHQRTAGDTRALLVQEIVVRDARVIGISPMDSRARAYAFEIGGGKLLFLQGQWLADKDIVLRSRGDAGNTSSDGPAPHCFPSRSFTITRQLRSGRVLSIRVNGDPAAAEREVAALRAEYDFNESELLHGDLDEIAQVLAKEHAERQCQKGTD